MWRTGVQLCGCCAAFGWVTSQARPASARGPGVELGAFLWGPPEHILCRPPKGKGEDAWVQLLGDYWGHMQHIDAGGACSGAVVEWQWGGEVSRVLRLLRRGALGREALVRGRGERHTTRRSALDQGYPLVRSPPFMAGRCEGLGECV